MPTQHTSPLFGHLIANFVCNFREYWQYRYATLFTEQKRVSRPISQPVHRHCSRQIQSTWLHALHTRASIEENFCKNIGKCKKCVVAPSMSVCSCSDYFCLAFKYVCRYISIEIVCRGREGKISPLVREMQIQWVRLRLSGAEPQLFALTGIYSECLSCFGRVEFSNCCTQK